MRFVPDAERAAVARALAEHDVKPRQGYADARQVFEAALAEARLRLAEPLTLEQITEIVRWHSEHAAFSDVGLKARVRWGERVSRIGLVRPSMGRSRGLAALATLARGCV